MTPKNIRPLTVGLITGLSILSTSISTPTATASWMVNGTLLTGTEAVATASVDEVPKLTAAGVTISCTSSVVGATGAVITAPDKGSAASAEFFECSANQLCSITKTIGTVPVIVTSTLAGSKAVSESITPKTKTVFATIKFEGAECALLGVQPVTGKVKAEAPTGQTESAHQLFNLNVSEATGELKVGSSAAEMKAASLFSLASGESWSFL